MSTSNPATWPRILITAGPTHEPIDSVRFLGNRSSGRLGISLAERAAHRGWSTTLLLGPTERRPTDSRVEVHRFQTTADLAALLGRYFDGCDILIMAAAVADFRPKPVPDAQSGKIRRGERSLTLELEPTPDLLAACGARKREGQMVVGFALEPRDRLMASARNKLARKSLDMIVANPLETMDSETIEAHLLDARLPEKPSSTRGAVRKECFAEWLLDQIDRDRAGRCATTATPAGDH